MAVISSHCASQGVYPPAGHYSYYVQTGQGDILQGKDRGLLPRSDEAVPADVRALSSKAQTSLPTDNSSLDLASQFCAFFGAKIDGL